MGMVVAVMAMEVVGVGKRAEAGMVGVEMVVGVTAVVEEVNKLVGEVAVGVAEVEAEAGAGASTLEEVEGESRPVEVAGESRQAAAVRVECRQAAAVTVDCTLAVQA